MSHKPVINVHCHLLNLQFIPEKMVKLLAHVPEHLAEKERLRHELDIAREPPGLSHRGVVVVGERGWLAQFL